MERLYGLQCATARSRSTGTMQCTIERWHRRGWHCTANKSEYLCQRNSFFHINTNKQNIIFHCCCWWRQSPNNGIAEKNTREKFDSNFFLPNKCCRLILAYVVATDEIDNENTSRGHTRSHTLAHANIFVGVSWKRVANKLPKCELWCGTEGQMDPFAYVKIDRGTRETFAFDLFRSSRWGFLSMASWLHGSNGIVGSEGKPPEQCGR